MDSSQRRCFFHLNGFSNGHGHEVDLGAAAFQQRENLFLTGLDVELGIRPACAMLRQVDQADADTPVGL